MLEQDAAMIADMAQTVRHTLYYKTLAACIARDFMGTDPCGRYKWYMPLKNQSHYFT